MSSDNSYSTKIKDGKLYKHILGNSELPENLYHVFKAWLDSAWGEFPYCQFSCSDCTLPFCLEDAFYSWFYTYFGVIKPDNLSQPTVKTEEESK